MAVIVVICLFPVIWSCIISIKSVGEKVSGFSALTISQPTLANYERLFELLPIWQHLGNSVFTSVMGTLTTLFFCSLAGFAFAKYRFPARNALFYFVVATMTIPAEVGSIPLFLIMRNLDLINNLWSLILPRLATAVGVFYLRQYMMEVPDEILEAARIDGCRDFGIFLRVVCPIVGLAYADCALERLLLAAAVPQQELQVHADGVRLHAAPERRPGHAVAGDPLRHHAGYRSQHPDLPVYADLPKGRRHRRRRQGLTHSASLWRIRL